MSDQNKKKVDDYNGLEDLLEQINILQRLFLSTSKSIMEAADSSIHPLDYFALSVIDRAISLNKGYKTLIESDNMASAVCLVRLQLDNLIRYYALLICDAPLKLMDHIFAGKPLNEYKENNQKFTDSFLARRLDADYPNSYSLYKHLCNYIHYGYTHIDYIFREKEVKSEKSSHRVVIGDSNKFNTEQIIDYTENLLFISGILLKLMKTWAIEKNVWGRSINGVE
ncbi:hypothetical protein RYH73_19425 [Olivibacter sp. CPCC 100613]|uniref:hypothetical protein n=1 Tax=Olivibacter sp. CPCC 100613 TaxID=3079931 RepID=UPI002FF98612